MPEEDDGGLITLAWAKVMIQLTIDSSGLTRDIGMEFGRLEN